MEQMGFPKQRLARLEERDRQVLNTEMRPARMLSLMLSIVSIVWLFVFLLLFKLVWVAIVGAALIGSNLGDISNLANDYLPKSAIDRATIRMAELLQHRLGASSSPTTPSSSSGTTTTGTTVPPVIPPAPSSTPSTLTV